MDMKSQTLLFKTPAQCMDAYAKKVKADGHGPGFRHGETQTQCTACWLYKYKDGRCNLFKPRGTTDTKKYD